MMGFGRQEPRYPELLAAFADGELDAVTRARVEKWLETNPAARSALETQQRLSRRNRKLWWTTSAPNPSEAEWDRVLNNIHDALEIPVRPTPAQPLRRRWRLRYLVPAISAAVAIVYLIIPGSGPVLIESAGPAGTEESLVLATDADIDIVSIDDRDALAILIGRRPLSGPVVLAGVGDVELKNLQKAEDGMLPKVQMNEAGFAPMIIAPIAGR
jgi:hypothetical protein